MKAAKQLTAPVGGLFPKGGMIRAAGSPNGRIQRREESDKPSALPWRRQSCKNALRGSRAGSLLDREECQLPSREVGAPLPPRCGQRGPGNLPCSSPPCSPSLSPPSFPPTSPPRPLHSFRRVLLLPLFPLASSVPSSSHKVLGPYSGPGEWSHGGKIVRLALRCPRLAAPRSHKRLQVPLGIYKAHLREGLEELEKRVQRRGREEELQPLRNGLMDQKGRSRGPKAARTPTSITLSKSFRAQRDATRRGDALCMGAADSAGGVAERAACGWSRGGIGRSTRGGSGQGESWKGSSSTSHATDRRLAACEETWRPRSPKLLDLKGLGSGAGASRTLARRGEMPGALDRADGAPALFDCFSCFRLASSQATMQSSGDVSSKQPATAARMGHRKALQRSKSAAPALGRFSRAPTSLKSSGGSSTPSPCDRAK